MMALLRHPRWKAETEKVLALAMQDVQNDGMSYKDAANWRGVPKSTIWNRMHGRQDQRKAHEAEQTLSDDEECEVVAWRHQMEQRYLLVWVVHLVGCAEMIWNNRNGTEGEKPGKHWVRGFLNRHPELELATSKQIDKR